MNVLTVDQVGALVGYPTRRIRALYRDGKFPAPIDPTLHPISWRWSPDAIHAYANGTWTPEVAA